MTTYRAKFPDFPDASVHIEDDNDDEATQTAGAVQRILAIAQALTDNHEEGPRYVFRVITIQPANTTTGDINANFPLPYPFHVDADTGQVNHQEFWQGSPYMVLGFQRTTEQTVDLPWNEAAADPQQVVGMLPVLMDSEGDIYNLTTPIASVTVTERQTRQQRLQTTKDTSGDDQ